MIRGMTFFFLLFSPIVQSMAWTILIALVRQKLPENKHQYQDSEQAIKNITNPYIELITIIKIHFLNILHLILWILKSFVYGILVAIMLTFKIGPYILHYYIMSSKNIVLTKELARKLLLQSKLTKNQSQSLLDEGILYI